MKRKLLGLLVGLVLVLAACGGNDETAGDATTVNAEKVFRQNCGSCHGQDLSGGVGPALDKIGSVYTQEEIESIIETGKGMMRGKMIVGAEVEAVAKWLAEKK
ncbi:cytochrome c551 [Bacillus sp. PS06]|uniref:cytochrome c551 n=1 Tax=Bacillus sp. PS06 TaxID=2764176 RepID=UPI001785124F|nr:cytochrome c [Bacillus sp. PS06]MBD8071417.1 cytochrome c [Bacillus sp. PS06]